MTVSHLGGLHARIGCHQGFAVTSGGGGARVVVSHPQQQHQQHRLSQQQPLPGLPHVLCSQQQQQHHLSIPSQDAQASWRQQQRQVTCHAGGSSSASGPFSAWPLPALPITSSSSLSSSSRHQLGSSSSGSRHSLANSSSKRFIQHDAAPAGSTNILRAAAAAAQQEQYWPEPEQQQQQPQQAGATTTLLDPQQPAEQDVVVAQQSQDEQPQQQQQPQQQVDTPAQVQQQQQPAQYSPLHYDIQQFVRRIVPTDAEKAEKQRIIQGIAVATRRSFDDTSGIRLQPFGSFVSGLSTWNSDIDLVVTGLVQPNIITGGFAGNDKRLVFTALERIAAQLRRYRKIPIKKMIIIRTARIPIIKLETTTRVVADISLGDGSGPKAAKYIAQQVAEYPPLGPLTLVLKVFLRSCGLNEVANGGLSSFSITNMALAHIMQELQEGRDVYDLGEVLYGFLLRFGEEFDVTRDAVSVASGGCVPRSELGHLIDSGPRERLLLEDPLTGRDVAAGSYRIAAVQAAFRKAARRLEQLASTHHNSSSGSSNGGGGKHGSSSRINYLEGLFNVQRVLSRDGKGFKGSGGKGLGLMDGGGVLAEEYYVLGRGGNYTDFDADLGGYQSDSQVDLPLEGDDYDDELEALLYADDYGSNGSGSRGRRGRRRHRG